MRHSKERVIGIITLAVVIIMGVLVFRIVLINQSQAIEKIVTYDRGIRILEDEGFNLIYAKDPLDKYYVIEIEDFNTFLDLLHHTYPETVYHDKWICEHAPNEGWFWFSQNSLAFKVTVPKYIVLDGPAFTLEYCLVLIGSGSVALGIFFLWLYVERRHNVKRSISNAGVL